MKRPWLSAIWIGLALAFIPMSVLWVLAGATIVSVVFWKNIRGGA